MKSKQCDINQATNIFYYRALHQAEQELKDSPKPELLYRKEGDEYVPVNEAEVNQTVEDRAEEILAELLVDFARDMQTISGIIEYHPVLGYTLTEAWISSSIGC